MNTTSQHYARDLRRYYRLPATQVSLTLVLSIFIMVVFIIFALRPTMVAVVTLRKTIVESRATLTQLEKKVINLQSVATEFENLKTVLPDINASISNQGANYETAANQIELLATETGVELQSESWGPTILYSRLVSPLTPKKNQSVIMIPVNLKATGGYPTVVTFLTQLLKQKRVMGVETIVITRAAGLQNESAVVTLDISGNVYYLADEKQLKTGLAEKKGP